MTLTHPKILVVDDSIESVEVIKQFLCKDYEVVTSYLGKQTLELAEAELPDLILLDIVMPDMDGYEVCQYLKANPATADIPVIFTTGTQDPQSETHGFALGAVDFINKPISCPVLLARVKIHLSMANQSRSLEEQVRIRTTELEDTQAKLRHST